VVLAESERTIVVEGNHYFPPESVKREFLRESSTQTTCSWKGVASYYDVVVDDVVTGGRQVLDKVPGKRKIEKAVRVRIRRLPAQFNLPSKKDITPPIKKGIATLSSSSSSRVFPTINRNSMLLPKCKRLK